LPTTQIHSDTLKYQSTDSSFIENKIGVDKLGRNVYYKNKRGRKITAIVDSKGIPINFNISEGNKHDYRIFKECDKKRLKRELIYWLIRDMTCVVRQG